VFPKFGCSKMNLRIYYLSFEGLRQELQERFSFTTPFGNMATAAQEAEQSRYMT